jgi:hypothetical protein
MTSDKLWQPWPKRKPPMECHCPHCLVWRRWLQDVQDASATSPLDAQVMELELMFGDD